MWKRTRKLWMRIFIIINKDNIVIDEDKLRLDEDRKIV